MAVSNITVTNVWVKIVSVTKSIISIRKVGNKNLFVNSINDDNTAEQVGPTESNNLIVQDEDKDVWVRSDSTTDWILTVRTEG